MAEQTSAKFDVKVWAAGILAIVGFLAGMFISNAQMSEATAKRKEATDAAVEKMNTAIGVIGSTSGFIVAVKKANPAVYDEALKGLTPKAQKDLAKLVEEAGKAK